MLSPFEVVKWKCKACDLEWGDDPGYSYCPDCLDDQDIETFTREDALVDKYEDLSKDLDEHL